MKQYNTEIISVGTELLLGHVTNTDARDVSENLSRIGVNVLYHTVVGDNPARLRQCIENAKERADIIITTGGLGPTCDDLTKQTLAEAFGLPLVLDEAEYRNLYDYISSRHSYTENNTQQAMLPEGCTVFHNTCGTAPGCAFEKDGKIVIMLPGPPKECREMLCVSVMPYLEKLSGETIVSHSVRVFGISESGVDDIFASEMNEMRNPTMAPYAKECDCLLQITAKAATEAEAEEMCRPVMERVIERLGDKVYGTDVDTLEERALQLLAEQGKTLALAESFTGGGLAKRLTDLPGGDRVLKSAYVLPSAGCSGEYAEKMAETIRASSGADTALAVSGEEDGTVYIALAYPEATAVKKVSVGTVRPRCFTRHMASNHAYDMLRRYLTGLEVI